MIPPSPLARVNPRVFHLAEAYDPEAQFVVVIRDLPRIGIYTARIIGAELAWREGC